MTQSMFSEQLQLLIAGYVLGDLDPEEAIAFEQLLANNPHVASEVNQMQNALEAAYAPPEVFPSGPIRSAILEANVASQQAARLSANHSAPSRNWFTWGRAMSFTAAALIAALGVSNYRMWQTLQAVQPEVGRSDMLRYTLKGTKTGSSATFVVNPNTLEARLSTQNLPPLPPEKTYVLWTVLRKNAPFTTDRQGAILTKVFQSDEANRLQSIPVPPVYRSDDWVVKVAITIEDTASPQKHAGAPVLITR